MQAGELVESDLSQMVLALASSVRVMAIVDEALDCEGTRGAGPPVLCSINDTIAADAQNLDKLKLTPADNSTELGLWDLRNRLGRHTEHMFQLANGRKGKQKGEGEKGEGKRDPGEVERSV
jgi:hypothetical protein